MSAKLAFATATAAEPSPVDLAAEVLRLRAENRELRAALAVVLEDIERDRRVDEFCRKILTGEPRP